MPFLVVWQLAWVVGTAPPLNAAEPLQADVAQVATVEELWRGYDPTALPLDLEPIRAWDEGDVQLQSLRLTGEIVDGVPVRVYAVQGAPRTGSRLPGVLHIHGGGQTASVDWVRYWGRRGYVCVTFDFCGKWEQRTEYTDWGPLKQGNMAQASGGFQLRPTVRESSWFHWTLVSRRALTLLSQHPQVDPNRLGIFGISVGGTLTWMVAGVDARVRAAVPIYGCGYNYDRRNERWGLLVANADYNLFQKLLGPEAYAPSVRCPVLFLSATNDGHGLMDRAYDALGATQAPKWQAISPRTDHHVDPREGRTLPLWMDWQLKGAAPVPGSPKMRVTLNPAGEPTAEIECEQEDQVTDVAVYYALGDERPQIRFWRSARGDRMGPSWRGTLPVLDAWDDLFAFANVTYMSGACLTTNLVHVIPAQLGRARESLVWRAAWEQGESPLSHWKFHGAYTDPNLDWTHLVYSNEEPVGPTVGFALAHLGDPVPVKLYTHLIGDPQYHGRPGDRLSFAVRGEFTADGLKLTVIE
ncbi:MAG: acetylxylan esterase, partial [Planctomycetes bacterium]|nr:acetylxylan esterase [Planctomycetota bacterium]